MPVIKHNPAKMYPQYQSYSHAVEIVTNSQGNLLPSQSNLLPNARGQQFAPTSGRGKVVCLACLDLVTAPSGPAAIDFGSSS